jgi:DNA-directed RNA polymerase subunit omega
MRSAHCCVISTWRGKHVEIDEPEAETTPPLMSLDDIQERQPNDIAVTFDRMTEDDLLRGLENLVPPAEPPEESFD